MPKPKNPKYSYIQWLPRNRIIISTVKTLLNSPYIAGIFGQNVFGYNRDDKAIDFLPTISLYHGQLSSPDNYDAIVGTICLDCYYGLDLNRSDETESIDTALETIRITMQNNNFFEQVSVDMFDYNKTLAAFRNDFDKTAFKLALRTRNPLKRYGIDFNVNHPNIINAAEIGDCIKTSITFRYTIAQQDYYELLEIMGIDGREDPNRIVYPIFDKFNITVEDI